MGNGFTVEGGVLRRAEGFEALEEARIPEGVVSIDNGCFASCGLLRRVVLPSTLRELGVGAFADCRKLEAFDLPKGITRIRKETFSGCESLATIVVPPTVTSIGEWAFRDCTNLQTVTLPPGVVEICAESFLMCPSLTLLVEGGSYAEGYAQKFELAYSTTTSRP